MNTENVVGKNSISGVIRPFCRSNIGSPKKFIAMTLTVLAVVSLGIFGVSAADIPAEPTAASQNKYYIGFDGKGDGTSADQYISTDTDGRNGKNVWGEDGDENIVIYDLVKDGGSVVIVGKGHCGHNAVFPATVTPIVFTGVDGATSYLSKNADGSLNINADGQRGMFMIKESYTLTFMGDVIFDNTVILERSSGTAFGTIGVGSTGKMVIKDTVEILKMADAGSAVHVEEGGYLYLHTVGFAKYTGKGTIVLDRALVNAGRATEEMFAGFEGKIVYPDGGKAFAETEIKMTIGDMNGYVNGVAKALDAAPIIRQNRTMLPVRFVAENLGAAVAWDGAAGTATLTCGDIEVKITIGAKTATVNGEEKPLDAPAFIENSRTYLPVRFVAEALGGTVAWDGVTGTATITKYNQKSESETRGDEMNMKSSGGENTASGFISPFRSISHIGDPFVMYDSERNQYFMYCTGGKFRCWSSDDMVEWTAHGDSYAVTEKSFGTERYWAPEVVKHNGTYYMVYSAARMVGEQRRHSIGLAASKTPTGPFTDVYDHPLFAPDYSVIDADLFFDDDGRVYLYYSRDCSENYVDGKRTSQTYGIELKPDLSDTVGEPVLLATPVSPWERKSGDTTWNEGPCVFKKDGVYYLLFTANYYASVHYCVGYATSDSPLGKFSKAKQNPILVGDGIYTSGTGHCNITTSPDGSELYMIYHSHSDVTNTTNPIADRTPCADKLVIRPDGSLYVNGPTVAKQPLPSGANGLYKKFEGVTVTSGYTAVFGRTELLKDGVIAYQTADGENTFRFSCDDVNSIDISYENPIAAESLWIYSEKDTSYIPENVYAVINGIYRTDRILFDTELPLSPAVIDFAFLPEGIKVNSVTLHFQSRDQDNGLVSVSEIMTIEKK